MRNLTVHLFPLLQRSAWWHASQIIMRRKYRRDLNLYQHNLPTPNAVPHLHPSEYRIRASTLTVMACWYESLLWMAHNSNSYQPSFIPVSFNSAIAPGWPTNLADVECTIPYEKSYTVPVRPITSTPRYVTVGPAHKIGSSYCHDQSGKEQ